MGRTFTLVQTTDQLVNQVQQNVAQAIRPLLNNAENFGSLLTGVELSSGANSINHGLNRKLQGWSVVRLRANASIYDTQDSNPNPAKTLLLTSSAAVTVDIYVF